ncbi:hypothetical protein BgiBS90_022747 [Biomphalaria glabrata]|nr:hypothetical protein BgiBS90_022747 [Biomphalaria glabrata]
MAHGLKLKSFIFILGVVLLLLFMNFHCFYNLCFPCQHPKPVKPKRANSSGLIKGISTVSLCDVQKEAAVPKCQAPGSAADKLRLIRDIFTSFGNEETVTALFGHKLKASNFEAWELPTVVHYVWCGNKFFRFEDYLGVLSMVRVLRPMKLIFHYDSLPLEKDLYHTWFQELKQSLPYLVLRRTNKTIACGTMDALNYGLEQLAASPSGGVFFGERAVLTYIPNLWREENYLTYLMPGASHSEETIVFARYGLVQSGVSLQDYKNNSLKSSYECVNIDQFNTMVRNVTESGALQQMIDDVLPPCLAVTGPLYPEHIITSKTPFGRVARFLYYGKSEPIQAKQSKDPKDLIPLISHMIMLNPAKDKPVVLTFSHYMSILSALYLGGFQRVYIHGDTLPSGEWWTRLANESVTFVYIEVVETVFQQDVKVYAHQSDILRAIILLKYGGAYQDKDALWSSPVPEDVRRYPAVGCYDWVNRGEWPRSFNTGVFLSKPGSTYLRQFLDSFWYEWDSSWIFNGVLMPYKVYERHPDTLFIDTHLQTICYVGVCHPAWHDDYMRSESEASKPTRDFKQNETYALHYTHPKPDSILTSFQAIQSGTSILHELGKNVLRAIIKSGKRHLVEGANLDKV